MRGVTLVAVAVAIGGCASGLRWEEVVQRDTPGWYRQFAEENPDSPLADSARARRQAILIERARAANSIEGWEYITEQLSDAGLVREAEDSLRVIRQRISAIAAETLDGAVRVEAEMVGGRIYLRTTQPFLLVDIHLGARQADEMDPNVRALSGTKAQLTERVQRRIFEVLQVMARKELLPSRSLGFLWVRAYGSIRERALVSGVRTGTRLVNLYSIHMSPVDFLATDWETATVEEVAEIWEVTLNYIPRLSGG